MTLDEGLRELIAEVVREEVKRALAEATKPDEVLTLGEAAELAKVCTRSVTRWIDAGKLTALHAGGRKRVSRRELEALLHDDTDAGDRDLTPEQLAERDFG